MTKSWPQMNRRVPSDDFEIVEGEEKFHPHEGEFVEFRRKVSPGDVRIMAEFAPTDVPDLKSTIQNYDLICKLLARVVVAWDWTGPEGEKYPVPHNNPEAFVDITDDELGYLMRKFQEPLVVQKNLSAESSPS